MPKANYVYVVPHVHYGTHVHTDNGTIELGKDTEQSLLESLYEANKGVILRAELKPKKRK